MKLFIQHEIGNRYDHSFRYDINALRAVSVMSVVFYHFGIPGFSGGFVGVDVFFVISGYLMTSIIVKGIESDKFSIVDFYLARVRRILPALICLCAATLVLGWCLLSPDDFVITSKNIQDVLLFKSNNTFRKEAGYFDVLAHDKWLLHTWSLSVEWQFYVILPIIISTTWMVFRKKISLLIVLIGIAVVSYISCILKTEIDSAKAFYMLKYRAWEMVVGGIIVFLPKMSDCIKQYKIFLLLIGYLLIVGSVHFINGEVVWPGYLAAFPVVGAAIVIYAAKQDFVINRIALIQWLGTGSYSIYLWHWPLVVLLAYFQKSDQWILVGVGVITSLLLGWFSYRFVEEKTRYNFGRNKYISPLLIIALGAIVYFISFRVVEAEGYQGRVDPNVVQISREKNNRNSNPKSCTYGEDRELGPISCTYGGEHLKAIVIGDSHASALVSAVVESVKSAEGGVYLWSRAACPFVRGAHTKIRSDCDSSVGWAFDSLKSVPPDVPVILITRGARYIFGDNEGLTGSTVKSPPIYFEKKYAEPNDEFLAIYKNKSVETICSLAREREVFLVKPMPEMKVSVPEMMGRYAMMGVEKRISVSLEEYYARNSFVLEIQNIAHKNCGVKILDPLPFMCDDKNCYADLNGRPMYFDDDHLSEFGNKVLVPMFSEILND